MNCRRPGSLLARTIIQKVENDQFIDGIDMKVWYELRQNLADVFQSKFVPLEKPDEITVEWLDRAKDNSSNICLQLWHALARTFLQLMMTQTDINGFLKRGSMFILSENQFIRLLQSGGFNEVAQNITGPESIHILDIGAGDGEITVRLAAAVSTMSHDAKVKLFATETSWAMRNRLKNHKITVIDKINDLSNVPLIACLNVLDRCNDPFELLQGIYNALAPNGRAIVALVLPYVHYVEFNSTHMPVRPLMAHWPERAKQFSYEAEATILFELLQNFGFKVEAWTKAPYLCEGDLRQSFYWLIDIVVVLSKKPTNL